MKIKKILMKYLKVFETNSQYTTFQTSSDYITPNVTLITSEATIKYNPQLFPINLVVGDNGELGIKLYEYISIKLQSTNKYTLNDQEIVYINGNKVTNPVQYATTQYFRLDFNDGYKYYLYSTGTLNRASSTHGGGSN